MPVAALIKRPPREGELCARLRGDEPSLPPAVQVFTLLCADDISFTFPQVQIDGWKSTFDGPADLITWAVEPYLGDPLWARIPMAAQITRNGIALRPTDLVHQDVRERAPDLYDTGTLDMLTRRIPDQLQPVQNAITAWWRWRIQQRDASENAQLIQHEIDEHYHCLIRDLTSQLRPLTGNAEQATLLAQPPWYLRPASGYTGPPLLAAGNRLLVITDTLQTQARQLLAIVKATPTPDMTNDDPTIRLW